MISFGNESLFGSGQPGISIPSNVDIVFVADMFTSDHLGGAELTTDAIIDASPLKVFRLHSKNVTLDLLREGQSKHWIFGNFAGMDANLIPSIIANMKYSVLEYDYKYCRYRSPEKHVAAEGKECDCHEQIQGKLVSAFYHGARSMWWMSEKQMEAYITLFPFLQEGNNTVLSSVFDEAFFLTSKMLREKYPKDEREGWVIIGSTSWIKGVEDAEALCQNENLEYEVLWNLPYGELLERMAQAKGLVFLPKGRDTCPRTVIEAKLLGCDLKINENVQHAHEIWFDTDDLLDTESYLYMARERFWNGIKSDMEYHPTISGYTTTRNCIDQDYPFLESIQSMLGFCDEVVVVDGGSTDGTWKKLQSLFNDDDRVVLHQEIRDWNHPRFAVFDGQQKAVARSLCTGDLCWQQDSDEIVHENDYDRVRNVARDYPRAIQLLSLPVIEYWGGPDKVRMDIMPWKWRLSKNLPHITHGIPGNLRRTDENGDLYAALGTDGCDYIHAETLETIPNSTFYTPDVDNLRRSAISSPDSLNTYSQWFNTMIGHLPGVHHYSWYNIRRKIQTYRDYWSQHWQSLYNIKQEDTPENNMFFQKSWHDVSDEELDEMSSKLADEMGGWIFHTPVNFDAPTPHITVNVNHPEVMEDWIKKQGGE